MQCTSEPQELFAFQISFKIDLLICVLLGRVTFKKLPEMGHLPNHHATLYVDIKITLH